MASRCGASRRSGSPTTSLGATRRDSIPTRQRAARITPPNSRGEAKRFHGRPHGMSRAGAARDGSTSTAAGRSHTRPTLRPDRPLETAGIRPGECGTSPNTSPQRRKELQIAPLAPARQAGGHWFEPSTAHSSPEVRCASRSMITSGDFDFDSGRSGRRRQSRRNVGWRSCRLRVGPRLARLRMLGATASEGGERT